MLALEAVVVFVHSNWVCSILGSQLNVKDLLRRSAASASATKALLYDNVVVSLEKGVFGLEKGDVRDGGCVVKDLTLDVKDLLESQCGQVRRREIRQRAHHHVSRLGQEEA